MGAGYELSYVKSAFRAFGSLEPWRKTISWLRKIKDSACAAVKTCQFLQWGSWQAVFRELQGNSALARISRWKSIRRTSPWVHFTAMNYVGQAGSGGGAVYIGEGKILGIDVGNIRYSGTYAQQGSRIRGTVALSAPNGGMLVTGTELPAGSRIDLSLDWSADLSDGQASAGQHRRQIGSCRLGKDRRHPITGCFGSRMLAGSFTLRRDPMRYVWPAQFQVLGTHEEADVSARNCLACDFIRLRA